MSRNVTCPACGNGSKAKSRDGEAYPISVYSTAAVSAQLDTDETGEQRLGAAQQVDTGRKRWATCGNCGHTWNLSRQSFPELWPWAT